MIFPQIRESAGFQGSGLSLRAMNSGGRAPSWAASQALTQAV